MGSASPQPRQSHAISLTASRGTPAQQAARINADTVADTRGSTIRPRIKQDLSTFYLAFFTGSPVVGHRIENGNMTVLPKRLRFVGISHFWIALVSFIRYHRPLGAGQK